jgi:hypothetical protein
MKKLEIYLPTEDFVRLERFHAIEQVQAPSNDFSNSFGGLNRVLSWMTKCNCAILSGWRRENTREMNDENNSIIASALREFGYGVSRCRGYYPEGNKTVSTENSFFVFDYNNTGPVFFNRIKTLSTQFEQDSFLFIEAGPGKRPYLYGTNDFFGIGRKEYLGPLHIGSFQDKSHTQIGNKEISFGKETNP